MPVTAADTADMKLAKELGAILRAAMNDTPTTLRLISLLVTMTGQLTLIMALWIMVRR